MVTEPEDIAMPNAGDGVCEVGMTDAGIDMEMRASAAGTNSPST